MDPDALRNHLAHLHAELAAAQRVEPQSQQQLRDILQDISLLMQEPAISSDKTTADEPLSLPDRLEQVAVRFEADHPTLAAASRRLVDLLGKAGL